MTTDAAGKPIHVYETFIKADPERIWEALTSAEFTKRYFQTTHIASEWTVGGPCHPEPRRRSARHRGRTPESGSTAGTVVHLAGSL